jgi:hypothetical protein
MQKLILCLFFIGCLFACGQDDGGSDSTGEFSYTVSGTASGTVSGTEAIFGPSTASSWFITLRSGVVDIMTFNILLDPLTPGDFAVNPVFVNGMIQPSMPGDSSGELQLGSIFSSGQKFFNTSSGDGGRVTATSIDGNVLRGNFQISMIELVGGNPSNAPKINVAGQFTALRQ